MIKAITEHGSHYLIDMENLKAKRFAGDGRGTMIGDGEWFDFFYVSSIDRNTKEHSDVPLQVGKSLYFTTGGVGPYGWRISTDIVSIEEF